MKNTCLKIGAIFLEINAYASLSFFYVYDMYLVTIVTFYFIIQLYSVVLCKI